jgi:hypothetical protein
MALAGGGGAGIGVGAWKPLSSIRGAVDSTVMAPRFNVSTPLRAGGAGGGGITRGTGRLPVGRLSFSEMPSARQASGEICWSCIGPAIRFWAEAGGTIAEKDSGKHNTAEKSFRQPAVMNGLLLEMAGTKKNGERSGP